MADKPKLLSGGNPQIPKGDGDGPVRAFLSAAPGWKQDVARRLDALIVAAAPEVQKAVKWNSPFYGMKGEGWFASLRYFDSYVKVAFHKGAALEPRPPGASKQPDTRYLDIHEGEAIDEAQFSDWIRQASRMPGVKL